MKYLFILNDSPYSAQRTYNALRLVRSLATGNAEVFGFPARGWRSQRRTSPVSSGRSYNVREMLRMLGPSVSLGACRTCLEARGIDESFVEGVQRRTLDDLRDWTEEA
jgi:uncharacterized protein involved in oxidation of intracellular sulfur